MPEAGASRSGCGGAAWVLARETVCGHEAGCSSVWSNDMSAVRRTARRPAHRRMPAWPSGCPVPRLPRGVLRHAGTFRRRRRAGRCWAGTPTRAVPPARWPRRGRRAPDAARFRAPRRRRRRSRREIDGPHDLFGPVGRRTRCRVHLHGPDPPFDGTHETDGRSRRRDAADQEPRRMRGDRLPRIASAAYETRPACRAAGSSGLPPGMLRGGLHGRLGPGDHGRFRCVQRRQPARPTAGRD